MSMKSGKTLVQILAEELKEWPKGVEVVTQSCVDGEIYDSVGDYYVGLKPKVFLEEHSEEVKYPQVTRAQWEEERAKLSKQKANKDGWIRHRGGKCPVEAGALIDIRMRCGHVEFGIDDAGIKWSHSGHPEDVMAYRIHQPDQSNDPVEVEASAPEAQEIDGPLQWRDRIAEIDRTVEALEEERVSLIQKLADEGFQLIGRK